MNFHFPWVDGSCFSVHWPVDLEFGSLELFFKFIRWRSHSSVVNITSCELTGHLSLFSSSLCPQGTNGNLLVVYSIAPMAHSSLCIKLESVCTRDNLPLSWANAI